LTGLKIRLYSALFNPSQPYRGGLRIHNELCSAPFYWSVVLNWACILLVGCGIINVRAYKTTLLFI
ncbi:hypothetical protein, partial [Staphylococcus sp. HMSC063A07]|uniref:hypothetical protein n=1 Tax=Staphylococcus sp. HMSC063A07 TaxID=1715076 RepID=UPI001C40A7C4